MMKALEARFFSSVGSSEGPTEAPTEVRCGYHGWSVSTLLYPTMREGDFAWRDRDDDRFLVGTREQYLHWLSSQDSAPNQTWHHGFLPLGMYCVRVGETIIHCTGISGASSYCADKSDFYPLLWALKGPPAGGEIDYKIERARLGSGVYKTFCKAYNVPLPIHWVKAEEVEEVEDNFLQNLIPLIGSPYTPI